MYDYSARNLISILVKNKYISMLKKKYVLSVIRLIPNLYFLKKENRNTNRF
jgi:hypothetical protein